MQAKKYRVVLLLVIVPWLSLSTALSPAAAGAAETGSFTGSWMANGTKEVLPLGRNRETALFRRAGHVNLKNDRIGKVKDFYARCIGLSDFSTGSDIRCVWRAIDGQEVYLTLQGTRMEAGSRVSGNIVGGTGSFEGISGYLHFTWTSMSFAQESGETGIGGFSQDISGSYQLP